MQISHDWKCFPMPLLQKVHPHTQSEPLSMNSPKNHDSWSPSEVGTVNGSPVCSSHFLNNWFPQSPWFPSNELPWNVANCLVCGVGPERLLKDTLKYERKDSCANCWGIFPDKLLSERSNASRFKSFPKEDGMLPLSMLLERFRHNKAR